VKVGERVKQDQPVLELETDKATIEVPSSVEGVITDLKVKTGDKVKPGQVVLVVDAGKEGAAEAPKETKTSEKASTADEAPKESSQQQVKQPKEEKEPQQDKEPQQGNEPPQEPSTEGQPDKEAPAAASAAEAGKVRGASVVDIRGRQSGGSQAPGAAVAVAQAPTSPAAPAVRRLARELGVNITQVTGSGPGGRISETDVKEFARHVMSSIGGGAITSAGKQPSFAVPLPDFSKWGEIERKQMSGIRRKTAEHLSHAWSAIPHVTQFDKADMTNLEQVRPRYAAETEKAGGKLTVTAVVVKILATALKKFPQFNASIDVPGDAIVYKKYVHIGVAVDTENGLLVPVVRNADQKNIIQIAVDIQQLAEKARARKLSLDEMSGGSMSVSNLGGIGGTAFTPIVNWPEVAILGISRGAIEAVYTDGKIEPRQMLPLSLSYDHRVIDGADAIRFLRFVVEAIEQPFTLALRG
jgi:pyruvate dehydrogenase E2 component (dihydrolipoamide acetyltransferase)